MLRHIELGPAPCDEPCAQLGADDYQETSASETKRYTKQLIRINGKPPGGAYFKQTHHQHDFGTYHEVAIFFNESSPEEIAYAHKVESSLPAKWDDEYSLTVKVRVIYQAIGQDAVSQAKRTQAALKEFLASMLETHGDIITVEVD